MSNRVSSFFSTSCTMDIFSSFTSSLLLSCPISMMPDTANVAEMATTPSRRPSCTLGTLPINIMMKMTRQSRAAVDRFSSMMSGTMKTHTISMYLNALRSAP